MSIYLVVMCKNNNKKSKALAQNNKKNYWPIECRVKSFNLQKILLFLYFSIQIKININIFLDKFITEIHC